MRTCGKCRADLPLESFAKCSSRRDGLQFWCRGCSNLDARKRYAADPGREKKRRARWRDENPDYYMTRTLRKYGLTVDDWNAMLEEQGGRCGICPRTPADAQFDVDHCHETGRVRGLLCNPCNRGIGLLGDTVERVRSAAVYLSQSSPSQ